MSLHALTWAFDQRLLCAQKFVLVALANHADMLGGCYPSQRSLSETCGLSRSRVNTALAELEELGLISIAPRRRENGSDSSCSYFLNMPPEKTGILQPSETRGFAYIVGVTFTPKDGAAPVELFKPGVTRELDRRIAAIEGATKRRARLVWSLTCSMPDARRIETFMAAQFKAELLKGGWLHLPEATLIAAALELAHACGVFREDTGVSSRKTGGVSGGDTGVSSRKTPIKNRQLEPSSEPLRGAAYPVDFNEFWNAYAAAFPGQRIGTKVRAFKAWDAQKGHRPPLAVLLNGVAAEKRSLEQANAKRRANDQCPASHASTWLNGRPWETTPAGAQTAGNVVAIDVDALRGMWGGKAAPIVDALGVAIFHTWLGNAALEGDTLHVSKALQRDYVRQHLADRIAKALKLPEIFVEVRGKVAA